MQVLQNWAKRGGNALRRDEVRIPVQTASAVLLAYGATGFLDAENVSWGVFSALFVVQASIGGTVSAALGRMAGALLGAALAVVLVMFLGPEGWRAVAALLIGVGVMSFLTARWPILAYGLVTVTIIVVAPDFQIVEGALKKVLAIAVGSTCGMIAALAVFPVSACRSEQAYLAAALRACGDFVSDCTSCLVGDAAGKRRQPDRVIRRSLDRAADMSRQSRIEQKVPRPWRGPFSDGLLPEIERFRYTLTLLDRFTDEPISEEVCKEHKDAFHALAASIKSRLDAMADAIDSGKPCDEMVESWRRYKEFSERLDESMDCGHYGSHDKERLMAIKGAFYSVLSNLTTLTHEANSRLRDTKQPIDT